MTTRRAGQICPARRVFRPGRETQTSLYNQGMASRTPPADDPSFPELQERADGLRERINRFRISLGRFFVAKQEVIDLMTVAAVAQEPLLIVGPPGTAKSDLVLKFKDALGLAAGDYFEYMLTRFTEPSEIIGPIDISQLREGRYIRREQ